MEAVKENETESMEIEEEIIRTKSGKIIIPGVVVAHVICNAFEGETFDALYKGMEDMDLIVTHDNKIYLTKEISMVA